MSWNGVSPRKSRFSPGSPTRSPSPTSCPGRSLWGLVMREARRDRPGRGPVSLGLLELLAKAQFAGRVSPGGEQRFRQERLAMGKPPLQAVLPWRKAELREGPGGQHPVLPPVFQVHHVAKLDGSLGASPEISQLVPLATGLAVERNASSLRRASRSLLAGRHGFPTQMFPCLLHINHQPLRGAVQPFPFTVTQ
jgi:hypothetical protein